MDFCSGGGHLGLVIAAARPDAQIHLVEKKKQHVDIAQKRIEMVGLVSISMVLFNRHDQNGYQSIFIHAFSFVPHGLKQSDPAQRNAYATQCDMNEFRTRSAA